MTVVGNHVTTEQKVENVLRERARLSAEVYCDERESEDESSESPE